MFEIEDFLENCANLEYEKDADLSKRSTFRIGGKAKYALYPQTGSALCAAADYLKNVGYRYEIIGNGSNVLFSDGGYDGALIFTTSLKRIKRINDTVYAECGAPFSSVALFAQKCGLSGLEFAYGIPGTVGGAVYMNAGAYGGEVADVLQKSSYFDPETSERGYIYKRSHGFGYRESSYMKSGRIILSATFELRRGDTDAIRETMDCNMAKRKEKQPLEYPSAGSAFKRYPGYFTAKLIDEAGLKGFSVGGAQVSEKHAGFIVNKGGATSSDVKKLIELIQKTIYEKNGIMIEREVRYID